MHWIERLSEYQDAELSPPERVACEVHLATCEGCRTALQELRLVTERARADKDTLPQTDLWPGVLERIGAAKADPLTFAKFSVRGRALARPGRHISFTLPELALAASLLVAVSAGVAYLAAGRLLTPSVPAERPIQAMAEPTLPPSADATPANFADAQFERAVSDLERILAEERTELDPRTVMVIERNLATIDEAIRQARAALAADPANPFLNSHLADARRRKLDLLRHATTLNASGD